NGQWTVTVREGLGGASETVRFGYVSPPRLGSLAGLSERAVFFGNDRRNTFRFARTHEKVTLVKGSSDFNAAAADRLQAILKPWGIECTTISAADANKPRTITADEALTYVGIDYAGKGQIKPGDGNSPAVVGYAVRGPVILLGNSDD